MRDDLTQGSDDATRIEAPTVVDGVSASAGVTSRLPLGSTVGRYVVLERLGAGAMGEVVRAYDPKLCREVALKRVLPHALGASGEERLVREAQAMAQLTHPHVVGVHDVEVDEGGVTVVMEYVRGATLGRWLEPQRPWDAIVDVLCQAGRGLAAAHAVDLVHRDFKPSNVLVDDDDHAKVTDFGLAKGTADAAEHTSGGLVSGDATLTVDGTVMGTPRYMAPEQHRGQAVDARADQYAFCVALWEALHGCPPFEAKYEELVEHKHRGPPPWPRQSLAPRRIADALTRGLDPDPQRRWPTMEALLHALTHDPSRARRRQLMGLGVLSLAGLAGAGLWSGAKDDDTRCTGARTQLATAWTPARRNEVEAAVLGSGLPYADATWARMGEALDAYAEGWIEQHTQACEATTLRGEQSSEVMDLRMSCLGRARTALLVATDLLAGADAQVAEHGQDVVMGLPPLSRCADVPALLSRVPPPEDPQVAQQVEAIREQLTRATVQRQAAKYDAALQALQPLEAEAEALGYGPLTGEVAMALGKVLHRMARDLEALEQAERALTLALEHDDLRTATTAASLVTFQLGARLERFDEAERTGAIALALALRQDDPSVEGGIHSALASLYGAQERLDDAEQAYRRGLELRQASDEPNPLDLAASHNNLGTILSRQGKQAEAEQELRAALQGWESARGPDHPDVAMAHNNLGLVLQNLDQPERAKAEFQLAAEIWETTLGPDHPHGAVPHLNLGLLMMNQGQPEAGEPEFRLALEIRTRAMGAKSPGVADARSDLARCLQAQGRMDEAEAELRTALEIVKSDLPLHHPLRVEVEAQLGQLLQEQGQPERARPHLERAWDQVRNEDPDEDTAALAFALAQTRWTLDEDRAGARTLATLARQTYEGLDEPPDSLNAVKRWLDEHPPP